ncbi:unnamed protein product [Orchesella dallaii]|uniref:Uncharacterized protein n=1 Tax=Orchesella dallaii TaxID=48710 RepID=A0ABP1S161_9HEXA
MTRVSKSTSLFLIFFCAATSNFGITLASPTTLVVAPQHNGNSSGEAVGNEVVQKQGRNLLAQTQSLKRRSTTPTAGSLHTEIKRKSSNDQNGDEAEDEKVSRNQMEDLSAELQNLKWNPHERKTTVWYSTAASSGPTKSFLKSHKAEESGEWAPGFFDLHSEAEGSDVSKIKENTLSLSDDENLVLRLDKDNYTPKEIADYIFWTGDEHGVAVTINGLVHQGLMTGKNDVIRFLEVVNEKLNNLQNHYSPYVYPRPTRGITKANAKDDYRGSDDVDDDAQNHNDYQQKLEHVLTQPYPHHYPKQHHQLMEHLSVSSLLDMPKPANYRDENPSLLFKTKGNAPYDDEKELDGNGSEEERQKTDPFSSLSTESPPVMYHHEKYKRWNRNLEDNDGNERLNLHSSFIGRVDKGKVVSPRLSSASSLGLHHESDNERKRGVFPVSHSKGIFEHATKENERKLYSSSQRPPIIADYVASKKLKEEDPPSSERLLSDNEITTDGISGSDEDDYKREKGSDHDLLEVINNMLGWLGGSGINDEKYDAHYSNIRTLIQHISEDFAELSYREEVLKHSMYLLVNEFLCCPTQQNHLFLDLVDTLDAVEQLMEFLSTHVVTTKIPKDLSSREIVELLNTALAHRTKEKKHWKIALEEVPWVANKYFNRKLPTVQRRERRRQKKGTKCCAKRRILEEQEEEVLV